LAEGESQDMYSVIIDVQVHFVTLQLVLLFLHTQFLQLITCILFQKEFYIKL